MLFNYCRVESFPVRTEMCSVVATDQCWSATRTGRSAAQPLGHASRHHWRKASGEVGSPEWLEESRVINMIIIQQFT